MGCQEEIAASKDGDDSESEEDGEANGAHDSDKSSEFGFGLDEPAATPPKRRLSGKSKPSQSKNQKPEKSEKPEKPEKSEKQEKPEKSEKQEKPEKSRKSSNQSSQDSAHKVLKDAVKFVQEHYSVASLFKGGVRQGDFDNRLKKVNDSVQALLHTMDDVPEESPMKPTLELALCYVEELPRMHEWLGQLRTTKKLRALLEDEDTCHEIEKVFTNQLMDPETLSLVLNAVTSKLVAEAMCRLVDSRLP